MTLIVVQNVVKFNKFHNRPRAYISHLTDIAPAQGRNPAAKSGQKNNYLFSATWRHGSSNPLLCYTLSPRKPNTNLLGEESETSERKLSVYRTV